MPKFFIEVLLEWYGKLYSVVKWGTVVSDSFRIVSGVRQGGILSPALFSCLVDDVLLALERSKLGCRIGYWCANSFMYADDLIILSASLNDLQLLVNLCKKEFDCINLNINSKKTCGLRVGCRHNTVTSPIVINTAIVEWKSEIKYLGIVITSARKFTINMQSVKHKFFRALNGIFGKVGVNSSAVVLSSLIETNCVPILLYGSESFLWNKSMIASMENVYSQIFHKIFKTFDKTVINYCQFYLGLTNLEFKIILKKCNFLLGLGCTQNSWLRFLYREDMELLELCNKYGISKSSNRLIIRHDIHHKFEALLFT